MMIVFQLSDDLTSSHVRAAIVRLMAADLAGMTIDLRDDARVVLALLERGYRGKVIAELMDDATAMARRPAAEWGGVLHA